MMDGRNYASWSPDAAVNERIQNQAGLKTNWSYRQYLQQNAMQIMNYNNMEACSDMGLSDHYNTDKTPSSNVPYTYKNIFDTSSPGFGYCNSDLKNPYLTREQLNSRLVSPSINTSNFSNK
jgi:hypothetical protein